MDKSADTSDVRLDIPAGDHNNPTMDRQHIDDNHNYPPHRSGISNKAYDVETNVDDDDDRLEGYNSDHHFIPIGGDLVLQFPGDDTEESVNGPELARYKRENDRVDNLNTSRDNLNKSRENLNKSRENLNSSRENLNSSRENLNSSRGRISPYNPSPVGFRPLNPSNMVPDSKSRDLKPSNQLRDSSPRDFNPSNQPHDSNPRVFNPSNQHHPIQYPTPYNNQSQTPNMSNPSGAGTDNRPNLNDSVDSEPDLKLQNEWEDRLKGTQNEAYEYDGDADTDHSFQGGFSDQFRSEPMGNNVGDSRFQDVPLGDEGDSVTMRNSPDGRDPFPVLGMGRPVSGRYLKNPSLERKKSHPAPGPFDPFVGMYVAPPPVVTRTAEVPQTTSQKRRKRIPQPPSKLKLKCACAWSCLACLIGSIFCAIPALRYAVTANESTKAHDYNSANTYLRRAIILCAVALVVGGVAWALFIVFYLAAR